MTPTPPQGATQHPTRHVIDGVPRVGFYPDVLGHGGKEWPEDIILPSCMRALMEFLGRPDLDYVHFVGVTGAGFFLNWKDGWHSDNTAIYYMVPFEDHACPYRNAFDSAGLEREIVTLKGDDAISEAEARERIIASIERGMPVLSRGVVGPPETCIITGYDDHAAVVVGWSFFQAMPGYSAGVTFEPTGMFRKRNWLPDTWDLMLFDGLGEPADPAVVRRRSLSWAVKAARTPVTWDGRHNGLAAYDAWRAHLLRDADIVPDGAPPPGAEASPFSVHEDAVNRVAEGRWYAARYLARVAADEPAMAADLYEAAAAYAREHDLMWRIWDVVGGNGRAPENARRFAVPAARRRIAAIVAHARELDEKAIQSIERALSPAD